MYGIQTRKLLGNSWFSTTMGRLCSNPLPHDLSSWFSFLFLSRHSILLFWKQFWNSYKRRLWSFPAGPRTFLSCNLLLCKCLPIKLLSWVSKIGSSASLGTYNLFYVSKSCEGLREVAPLKENSFLKDQLQHTLAVRVQCGNTKACSLADEGDKVHEARFLFLVSLSHLSLSL